MTYRYAEFRTQIWSESIFEASTQGRADCAIGPIAAAKISPANWPERGREGGLGTLERQASSEVVITLLNAMPARSLAGLSQSILVCALIGSAVTGGSR